MVEPKKKYKANSILIMLLAFVVLLLALNWKSLTKFDRDAFESFKQADDPQFMTIYYYPDRQLAAEALTYYFSEQGYKVSMSPASALERLKSSENAPSYVFFNQEHFSQAMKIKSSVEKVLKAPVNAYRFGAFQDSLKSPAIMMVFTETK